MSDRSWHRKHWDATWQKRIRIHLFSIKSINKFNILQPMAVWKTKRLPNKYFSLELALYCFSKCSPWWPIHFCNQFSEHFFHSVWGNSKTFTLNASSVPSDVARSSRNLFVTWGITSRYLEITYLAKFTQINFSVRAWSFVKSCITAVCSLSKFKN